MNIRNDAAGSTASAVLGGKDMQQMGFTRTFLTLHRQSSGGPGFWLFNPRERNFVRPAAKEGVRVVAGIMGERQGELARAGHMRLWREVFSDAKRALYEMQARYQRGRHGGIGRIDRSGIACRARRMGRGSCLTRMAMDRRAMGEDTIMMGDHRIVVCTPVGKRPVPPG